MSQERRSADCTVVDDEPLVPGGVSPLLRSPTPVTELLAGARLARAPVDASALRLLQRSDAGHRIDSQSVGSHGAPTRREAASKSFQTLTVVGVPERSIHCLEHQLVNG